MTGRRGPWRWLRPVCRVTPLDAPVEPGRGRPSNAELARRYADGWTLRELGEQWGVTRQAVHSRIKRYVLRRSREVRP